MMGGMTVPSGSPVHPSNTGSTHQPPRTVAVVGAGMVGLATAWFLQERGVEVTVLDREGVAAGSSWGNAGWLTPSIATPLPEPAVLRYGIKAVLSPSSPVYVPPTANRRLLSFAARFARNSTPERWRRAMSALVPINTVALSSFDALHDGGLNEPTYEALPFLAAYQHESDQRGLLEEFAHIEESGQAVPHEVLTGDQARALEPLLSREITTAVQLNGQRFINPGRYVDALADAVRARGGKIEIGVDVDALVPSATGVGLAGSSYDAVVIATGTWLGKLARPFGVRTLVQAGRGYSFSVPVTHVPNGPVYFPAERVACTPLGDRLRVAGMMEFRKPGAPMDRRRITAIVDAARPLLTGADLDDRQDEWVGSRPCTPDGLPLIGATATPRVYVAGGHGMWGITLGPATGALLAEQIVTGRRPTPLAPFEPLR